MKILRFLIPIFFGLFPVGASAQPFPTPVTSALPGVDLLADGCSLFVSGGSGQDPWGWLSLNGLTLFAVNGIAHPVNFGRVNENIVKLTGSQYTIMILNYDSRLVSHGLEELVAVVVVDNLTGERTASPGIYFSNC